MTIYSKINIIYRLQKWMDSVPGQTFLNYAYSWGASIVILGTLFKLTHLPGANFFLFLGMGTEVLVFFISRWKCVCWWYSYRWWWWRSCFRWWHCDYWWWRNCTRFWCACRR